ncbi:PspA/IM30 family protein [Thioflavicoccus mobilis]|uniref:PspA/IM30 family protein n=1 Tax=Thioflavicoccus mobilis TaxID=80679 RepID=UPI00031E367B|nr:PspA/IM30 family protein [Thioflavicoccus mobilis]
MAFITRLSRLVRADLHAMLDRLEAPDLVLSQAVREMEQALDRGRLGLARLEREQSRLQDRAAELERRLHQTSEALEDCLAAGQDDLARPVIRRRLETERQAGQLAQRLRALETDSDKRRQRLAEQEAKLADLRARATLYEESRDTEQDGYADWPTPCEAPVQDADVEIALLQAKRQREAAS